MLAYLVIRDGTKWSDVYRLIPGQTATIGRAPTNQIVLKDERCSRSHAEVFWSESHWVLRDLDSRNGTLINEVAAQADQPLAAGDVIRIGRSQLAFVTDLAQAFSDSAAEPPVDVSDTPPGEHDTASTLEEPSTIIHRRGQTRFLEPGDVDESAAGAVAGEDAAAHLCRLAFEMAQCPDATSLARRALDGLFSGIPVDTGGVLLLPRASSDSQPAESLLEVLATRSDRGETYRRVSRFLASTVLREGEAVLARNVLGDSAVSSRDSQGEFHATSVICAPIRRENRLYGLLHLYSTDAQKLLQPEDLEFTLAVADTLAVALQNLSRRQELTENLKRVRHENQQLRERLGVETEIVGRSAGLARIADEIARAAPSKATVLIRGESGVGKELVARAVHFASPRRKGVFICLNCAALSETLLESELFGHEKGAFTGAVDRKVGKFEAAHGGTLMLDEIGEMSPVLQAKFLRVLEGHPYERVGGNEPVKVDVRVIAATNRDLEREVAEGRFRRDLYFRLKVVEIIVPPLRKRLEDIPELADYFLQRFNAETGRKIKGYTTLAREQMLRYRWPGNVRELKNVVERAIVLCEGEFIDAEDLVLSKLPTAGDTGEQPLMASPYQPLSLDEVERRHIVATLQATQWNKSQASQILGIERSTLDRKIRRYELIEPQTRRARQ